MAKNVQMVGNTAAQEDLRTGLDRQITIDTTNYEIRIHDGVTPGGHRVPSAANALLKVNDLSDVASAPAALTNIGALGKANNLSDVASISASQVNLGLAIPSSTRAILKALDTTKQTVAFLAEGKRSGIFIWRTGNYATKIAEDIYEANYLKADAIASTSGAWERGGVSAWVRPEWFGALADGVADDQIYIQAAINWAESLTKGTRGGIVRLSPSVYACGDILIIEQEGVQIIGSGRGTFIDSTYCRLLITHTNGPGIRVKGSGTVIKDFQIQASGSRLPASYGTTGVQLIPTALDTVAETYTFGTTHGIVTGQIVVAATTESGLTAGYWYYAEAVTTTTLKLHNTFESIAAGTPINLTGSLAAQKFTPRQDYITIPAGMADSRNDGIQIAASDDGASSSRVNDVIVENVISRYHPGNGITVVGDSIGTRLTQNDCRYNNGDGIHVGAGTRIGRINTLVRPGIGKIDHCQTNDNGGHGVILSSIDDGYYTPYRWEIDNNESFRNGCYSPNLLQSKVSSTPIDYDVVLIAENTTFNSSAVSGRFSIGVSQYSGNGLLLAGRDVVARACRYINTFQPIHIGNLAEVGGIFEATSLATKGPRVLGALFSGNQTPTYAITMDANVVGGQFFIPYLDGPTNVFDITTAMAAGSWIVAYTPTGYVTIGDGAGSKFTIIDQELVCSVPDGNTIATFERTGTNPGSVKILATGNNARVRLKGFASTYAELYHDASGRLVCSTNDGVIAQAIDVNANICLGGIVTAGASAAKTMQIGNGTAPTGNIAGGQLYVESGVLKYRGSGGTITTLGLA